MATNEQALAWVTTLYDLEKAYERHRLQHTSMEWFGTYDYEDLSLDELHALKEYMSNKPRR